MVIGGPAAVVFLLGTPELALPSEWSDARARINDGTYPAGYVIDILSVVVLLAWLAGLWFLVMGVRKRDENTVDETGVPTMGTMDDVSEPVSEIATEPDEPWYRQGGPIFEEPFSDEYPRVVVPPDETAPDDELQDALWQQNTIATDTDEPFGMLPPDPMGEDRVADAEIIGRPGMTDGAGMIGGAGMTDGAGMIGGAGTSAPDEPPMIVPVRAYYFTRAEDTLRSISAQFLQTPRRWEELRSLNAASPGVAALGPDSLLPVGTALALPGDPLPWGKPDPVYLWTLAEKFLFTAWGREPTPEEVVPFWRGLTSGNQLEAGAPPIRPEHLTAAPFPEAPTPEAATAPARTEPPTPTPPEAPTPEAATAPARTEPPTPTPPEAPTPEVVRESEPVSTAPPMPGEFLTPPPPVPGMEPSTTATDSRPPPPVTPPAYDSPIPPSREPTPPAYDSPVPPSHEPVTEPAAYQPPPAYDSPVPPSHEPAGYQPPPAYDSPVPPSHEPSPPAYDSPLAPTHEPAGYQPPPAYDSPVPPSHEPVTEPAAYQPPPAYDSPVPPSHEPAGYQPPPAYDSPVPPSHEPRPPAYDSPLPPTQQPPPPTTPAPGLPDLGPIEPEVPYVEAEAPRMPSFLPSLTGAESAAPPPEAEVVASSNRGLAGTAIGDAMMLWQLSRLRRRRGGPADVIDPIEESLRQSARVDTLNLIEAAMRHLRAVTVGQLREKPAVLAVRVGTYGFEVLLNRPAKAPDGWQTASGGYVLELPPGTTTEDLDGTAQGPTLCPALVPVGDTVEGPLLLNIEEIGCLIVSGPGTPSVSLLNAVVGTLGSSPLAADIRIITVGLDTPAGLPGWERVHSTSFDSPQLEELLSTAHTGSGASLDVLVVGPGNDLLIQRAGQVATTPGSRLALVGATSSVAARWPWRIHVDETTTAVVHPIACTMAAAQAMAPAMSQLLSGAADPSLLAPPRF